MARSMARGGSYRMLPPMTVLVLLSETIPGLRQAPHLVEGYCDVGAGDPLETDVCRVAITACSDIDAHSASTDLVGERCFTPESEEIIVLDTSEAGLMDGRHSLSVVPRITGNLALLPRNDYQEDQQDEADEHYRNGSEHFQLASGEASSCSCNLFHHLLLSDQLVLM